MRSRRLRSIGGRKSRPSERTLSLADGATIVRAGDPPGPMYVIQSGRVEIRRQVGGRAMVMAVLERGDFFGEMSLLESLPREADAVALGPVVLLELDETTLLLRLRRDPTLAVEMLHHLSGRLRSVYHHLDGADR